MTCMIIRTNSTEKKSCLSVRKTFLETNNMIRKPILETNNMLQDEIKVHLHKGVIDLSTAIYTRKEILNRK